MASRRADRRCSRCCSAHRASTDLSCAADCGEYRKDKLTRVFIDLNLNISSTDRNEHLDAYADRITAAHAGQHLYTHRLILFFLIAKREVIDLIGEDLPKAVHEIGYAGRVEFSYDPALGAGDDEPSTKRLLFEIDVCRCGVRHG